MNTAAGERPRPASGSPPTRRRLPRQAPRSSARTGLPPRWGGRSRRSAPWQTHGMSLHTSTVEIRTSDGVTDGFVVAPDVSAPHPAVLLYMDAFGLRKRLEEM